LTSETAMFFESFH